MTGIDPTLHCILSFEVLEFLGLTVQGIATNARIASTLSGSGSHRAQSSLHRTEYDYMCDRLSNKRSEIHSDLDCQSGSNREDFERERADMSRDC